MNFVMVLGLETKQDVYVSEDTLSKVFFEAMMRKGLLKGVSSLDEIPKNFLAELRIPNEEMPIPNEEIPIPNEKMFDEKSIASDGRTLFIYTNIPIPEAWKKANPKLNPGFMDSGLGNISCKIKLSCDFFTNYPGEKSFVVISIPEE